MSFVHHQELVQGISAALKGLKLYPMKHPAIEQRNRTLLNAFTQLFSSQQIIHIGLLEGTLFVEDTLFACAEFYNARIKAEIFDKGIQTPDQVCTAEYADACKELGITQ